MSAVGCIQVGLVSMTIPSNLMVCRFLKSYAQIYLLAGISYLRQHHPWFCEAFTNHGLVDILHHPPSKESKPLVDKLHVNEHTHPVT